jgi:hypothetical protein
MPPRNRAPSRRSRINRGLPQASNQASHGFKRQCYIALDVDEDPAVDVVNKMGAEYFVVSSDYPTPTVPSRMR